MKNVQRVVLVLSLLMFLISMAHATPQPPVLSVVTDGIDVTISWPLVKGATGYNLSYAPYPAGSPIASADLGALNTLSFPLWEGAAYFLAASAYDGEGSSGNSNIVILTIPPAGSTTAVRALGHMSYISETIGIRVAASAEEKNTRDYIVNQLTNAGLDVQIQTFAYESRSSYAKSYNVVAVLPGASPMEIIVGAHYDSVGVGQGASDNASGMGALLALAESLVLRDLPYTVRFIAFGAEEVGLRGARFYTSQMTTAEIANTLGMINLDTIVGGDKIYVYGDAGVGGWIRDQALAIALGMSIPLETNPGLNPSYPAGTTGDWSDHAPFRMLGIPYAYFEATNWEIGDLDGYLQTAEFGAIWHTENDTMAFFNQEFPGRVEQQITDMVNTLEALLLELDPPAVMMPVVRESATVVRYTDRQGNPF